MNCKLENFSKKLVTLKKFNCEIINVNDDGAFSYRLFFFRYP